VGILTPTEAPTTGGSKQKFYSYNYGEPCHKNEKGKKLCDSWHEHEGGTVLSTFPFPQGQAQQGLKMQRRVNVQCWREKLSTVSQVQSTS
jgi:hypothetical protein